MRAAADSPDSPELARALWLVRRLAGAPIAAAEIDVARERVRARIFAAIAAQDDGVLPTVQTAARDAGPVTPDTASAVEGIVTVGGSVRISARHDRKGVEARRSASRLAISVVVAALALGLMGLLAASQVARAALPGAPLYSLKRSEEWVALATAWSDTRRGQVLGEIAHQRLAEARAEAAAGNAAEVHALTAELDSTMRALISLTARMTAHHEDSGTVAAALAQTLADECAVLMAAAQQGQVVLVQSLSSAAQEQQRAISAANLSLPGMPPLPGAAPSATPGAARTPPSAPAPNVPPTPTPATAGGGASGSSQGSGHGIRPGATSGTHGHGGPSGRR